MDHIGVIINNYRTIHLLYGAFVWENIDYELSCPLDKRHLQHPQQVRSSQNALAYYYICKLFV